jgi:hypothetical protein
VLSAPTSEVAALEPLFETTLNGVRAVAANSTLKGIVSTEALNLSRSAVTTSLALPAISWLWAVLVCVGVVVTVKSGAFLPRVQTLQRSFLGKQFDTGVFQLTGPMSERYVKREDQGFRITLPAQNGPAQPVGIRLKFPVRGDFQVEASYEVLTVQPGRPKTGAGVTLYFFLDDEEWNGLWVGKMNDRDQEAFYLTGGRIKPGVERTTSFSETVRADSNQGIVRLRATRKGTTVDLYAAEGRTGPFKRLHSASVSDRDLQIVRFGTDPSWSANALIDVRLLDFTLSAREIVGIDESLLNEF